MSNPITYNSTMQDQSFNDRSFDNKSRLESNNLSLKYDLNDKTGFSLETDSCIADTKIECSKEENSKDKTLSFKRLRNNKEEHEFKRRITLKKDSNKRSSKRKRNKSPNIGKLDGQTSNILSDVQRKSEFSLNTTIDNIQKDLKVPRENKLTLLDFKECKDSMNEITNKIKSNTIIIKTIKLSLDKLKTGNKAGLKKNLNLFDLLKTDADKDKDKDIKETVTLIDIDQALNDKTKRKVSEFITPNKVNFYEEHKKKFYTEDSNRNVQLDDKKEGLINMNKEMSIISDSPFKLVNIPESLLSSKDYIYFYSNVCKTLLIIGFFGTVILFLQDKNINNCLGETLEYLLKYWKSNFLIIASILIMIYYFHLKVNDNNMYKENLAKMIYENMKMVLESEKSNQEFISITQKDIITYFTYQLKVTEDFLAYNVIPLISKMAQNDESLLEEKENSGDSLILSWKLNTNK